MTRLTNYSLIDIRDDDKTVYDETIPVDTLSNDKTPANLHLINRPDLMTTFTKIELWRQTQFGRIVYIDSDVLALRAPDELLLSSSSSSSPSSKRLNSDIDPNFDQVNFAAVPDTGWPDCFNSGVMVLRPNMEDYHALLTLAEKGASFDGADQGLLNLHFRGIHRWHRLGFGYNCVCVCTPSAGYQYQYQYQYLPAFGFLGDSVRLVHFVGGWKPWECRCRCCGGGCWRRGFGVDHDDPYGQLLGRWWDVFDRYCRSGVGRVDLCCFVFSFFRLLQYGYLWFTLTDVVFRDLIVGTTTATQRHLASPRMMQQNRRAN